MKLHIDIQTATTEAVPDEDDIRRWIGAALSGRREQETEISLRLVDREEMAALNRDYRGRRGATNVLSFPAELPSELALPLLGDIVICAPVVRDEATQQGKTLAAHWAHMTIHGTLHLLGYDHVADAEAALMEQLETDILAALDYPCPYRGGTPKEQASA